MPVEDVGAPRRIKCPSCGAVLGLPPACTQKTARCGKCRQYFRIPSMPGVTDEAVAQWLVEEGEPAAPVGRAHARASAGRTPGAASGADKTEEVTVVKIDSDGVLLEFPVGMLRDVAFRSAMPRRCMQCGARDRLEAHVAIFSDALADSVSLEVEQFAVEMIQGDAEIQKLYGSDLLARFPRVPNVPAPADRPMPYWLCDLCRASESVTGQLMPHGAPSQAHCRLSIQNAPRAVEFLHAAGAEGTEADRAIREHLARTPENPWDRLPLVVRRRVQQWYKPDSGESFLAYVPDRGRSRNQDGMAGLLVSSGRLIYHTDGRHRETPANRPLAFHVAMHRADGDLEIHAPSWEIKHFCVDRDGVVRLRKALDRGKFKATWR